MKDHLSDIIAAIIGLSLAYWGASAAYASITGPRPTEVAYWASLSLVLVGGMLIGVAINKISLRLKKAKSKKS